MNAKHSLLYGGKGIQHVVLFVQGVYRSFVQNAKFVNAASVPHIHFMASCVVEMFGLDMAASYQQAFTAIRQLAVLLRGALSMRTKDAFRQVYCWQTLNCLELWAKVLAAHADKQVSCSQLSSSSTIWTYLPTPWQLTLTRSCAAVSDSCDVCSEVLAAGGTAVFDTSVGFVAGWFCQWLVLSTCWLLMLTSR